MFKKGMSGRKRTSSDSWELLEKPSPTKKVKISIEEAKVTNAIERCSIPSGSLHFSKVNILPDSFNKNCYSFGDILQQVEPVASIHFNFMIDVDWLIEQYPPRCRSAPMTLVVGEKMGTHAAHLRMECKGRQNLTVLAAKLPIPFGTHHTKLSILESETAISIIISTANLVPGDWGGKTQCFYYLQGSFNQTTSPSASPSPIITDLLQYLTLYNLDAVDYWKERISAADFGNITERLIFSVPGYHQQNMMKNVGHTSLREILGSRPVVPSSRSRLLVSQCSSIGSLGSAINTWLMPQFGKSLKGGRDNNDGRMLLIYPTVEDVRGSIEGYEAGGSLPYQKGTASRQPWLKNICCKWRSEKYGRSRAMPHCKSYTEIVDGEPQWLLITSANLSKAAWGEMQKNCTQLMIRSYELGVLFTDMQKCRLPYDYPIAKYKPEDEPWICDINYTEPDSHGEKWVVSL